MATIENNIKKGQYLKKTGADSYVHYHFDTDDSIVYLSDNLNKIEGEENSSHYAKDAKLHDTLCALYTLASKGGQASTDLATLKQKVNEHIQNVSNPHRVNKGQVGLGSVINAPMDNEPIAGSNNYVKSGGVYTAVRNVSKKANSAYDLASGLSKAYVFGNASAVYHGRVGGTVDSDGATAGTVIDKAFKVGDSVYVKDTLINDFWISAKRKLTTDNTELPISSIDDIKNATDGAEINVKWTIGREYYYVTLTAVETKANLDGYYDKNYIDNNFYDKTTIQRDYVPYSGANNNVKLGNHTITVGDATVQANQISTIIAGGNITLNGLAKLGTTTTNVGRKVEINVTGITVDEAKTYKYPLGNSGTLATQEFVTGQGYQTVSGVKSVISTAIGATTGDVTFSGSVDNGITTTLSNTKITPGTYSALTVDAKGRATAGAQQIVFAPNLNDSHLSSLAIGGVAIIDA